MLKSNKLPFRTMVHVIGNWITENFGNECLKGITNCLVLFFILFVLLVLFASVFQRPCFRLSPVSGLDARTINRRIFGLLVPNLGQCPSFLTHVSLSRFAWSKPANYRRTRQIFNATTKPGLTNIQECLIPLIRPQHSIGRKMGVAVAWLATFHQWCHYFVFFAQWNRKFGGWR